MALNYPIDAACGSSWQLTAGGAMRPNFLVILIDDPRFDELGAGRPSVHEDVAHRRHRPRGTLFERAFHATPICSPNRASILTGQYASRHGIIDNVARRCQPPVTAARKLDIN
jgi:arylsulfatase A-like enzyme